MTTIQWAEPANTDSRRQPQAVLALLALLSQRASGDALSGADDAAMFIATPLFLAGPLLGWRLGAGVRPGCLVSMAVCLVSWPVGFVVGAYACGRPADFGDFVGTTVSALLATACAFAMGRLARSAP